MKNKRLLLTFIGLLTGLLVFAQYNFRKINNEAFKRGEKLSYRIHYGFIDAVTATIEVTQELKNLKN